MKKTNKIVFIAGGGTGGHLYPAFSIGKELKKNGIEIIYIGSKNGIENKIFPQKNEIYYLLNITGIQRGKNAKSIIQNLSFPFKFLISYFLSIMLIIKHKPEAIIGTGGYCSGLPLIAGITLNIPTYIQDQNSIPGLVTKKLNNKINKIFLGYEEALIQLNNKNCIVSGNPLRQELVKTDIIIAKRKLKFNTKKKLLFILGGSQGANSINNHILKNINYYINNDYQLLWQCGDNDYEYLNSQINYNGIKIKRFIEDMSISYSAADLIISRAGALAINEITYFGKPSIIIPFPQAAENHQLLNAKSLESKEACIIVEQSNLFSGKLEEKIDYLFNKEKSYLNNITKNSKNIFKANATKIITNEIIKHISC